MISVSWILAVLFPNIISRRVWQAMDPQAAYNIHKIGYAFNMSSTQLAARVNRCGSSITEHSLVCASYFDLGGFSLNPSLS